MRLLWLCGPSGVGKSSAGWELFTELGRDGVRTGFLDTDQISLMYPFPAAETHRLRARALAALWPSFRAEGVRCMVMSGFVDSAEEIAEYGRLLPDASMTVCRLRADPAELEARFTGRGWRPELAAEAVAEARELDRSGFADLTVDTTGLTVQEVAREDRRRAPAGRTTAAAEAHPRDGHADGFPVLWISGATAVGKSTVGYEVFTRLFRSGTRTSSIDTKQITAVRPAPSPAFEARNLAALLAAHRAEGARRLVVSGDRPTPIPGARMTVCRLGAQPGTLAVRIKDRAAGRGPAIPGDRLRGLSPADQLRVAERAAEQAREGDADLEVATDGRSPQELAAEIIARL